MRAVVIVAVLLGVLGASRPAHAAKAFESGPLPPPYDQLAGAHAGYVCDVSGVFGTYYAIDNCQPAAIRGHEFDASPEIGAAVAAIYPEPSIPFWAAHGWKLVIGAVVAFAAGVIILVARRRSTDEDHEEATDLVRAPRFNPANLPMPEAPHQHVHRPMSSIEYAPHTTLGHAAPQAYPRIVHPHPQATVGVGTPAIGVPASSSAAFGRVNSSDHEAPTVAYGARGYAAPPSRTPAYLTAPYVHEPYVQQRARSFPPVPTFEPSGPADDGPTTYDPAAAHRAEQAHAELARGSSASGFRKK